MLGSFRIGSREVRRGASALRWAALGLTAVACAGGAPRSSSESRGGVATRTVHTPSAPRLSGPPSRAIAVTTTESWKRAAQGDVIDQRRLADEQGAIALLDIVRAGGDAARVALSALPFAPDAELALDELCRFLPRARHDQQPLWLASIAAILRAPPAPRERLDAKGLARCDEALVQVARDSELQPGDRDLAASARQSLREHRAPPGAP